MSVARVATSVDAPEDEGAMLDLMLSVIKELATDRLFSFGVDESAEPKDASDTDMTYDHWIGEIHLCYPSIEVAFRSHFSSKIARMFAHAMLGADEHVDIETCHSFMTEFCNLTAGAFKNVIADVVNEEEAPGDLGLPNRRPSFDEVQLATAARGRSMSWKYEIAGEELVCWASLSINGDELWRLHGLSLDVLATRVHEAHASPPELDEFDDFLL